MYYTKTDKNYTNIKRNILWRIDGLLGKDLETKKETTAVAMQRRGKHVSTTIVLLLETVFSTRSVQRSYLDDNWGGPVSSRMRVQFCTGGP
jgi:hypothetical protein